MKASYKSTAINLFKGLVGSGVIALPYSFEKGGYIMSAMIFVVISLMINYTQNVV
jgi:proton-coupled amino acid transporter